MQKHYQLPGEKTQGEMYQVHSGDSGWFLDELGPVFSQCDLRPSLHKSQRRRALEWRQGRKRPVFELGAMQTQTVHGSLCGTERRTKDPLALQTLPAVQRDCVCVCVRAHLHALLPVHSCGQIQIWSHTLCQCTLFNFARYVNSNAKACIWCIRKV